MAGGGTGGIIKFGYGKDGTVSKPGTGGSHPATGTTGGSATSIPLISLQDVIKGVGKFNPPPHNVTRSVSPVAFANYQVSRSADSSKITSLQKANRRGYFYQDLDSAFNADGRPKGRNNLWGFQFMFNPNALSHQNSANTGIDWTNNQDISNLLTGSQTFSISLFFNRTVDVAQLSSLVIDSQGSPVVVPNTGVKTGYTGRTLTSADILGIVTRGTEYDLEFLYRVVNGEPQNGPAMDAPTADLGYLSGLPIWVRLNNQMRYKGTISSLGVQHLMFTPDMVPVVTEVSISFTRIPVPLYGTADEQTAWYKSRYGDGKVPTYKNPPNDQNPGGNP